MTFEEIIALWRALPKDCDTGEPLRDSVAMRDFMRTLTAPDRRGWFGACHDWHHSGPSPDEEINAILSYFPVFQRNMAHAHLDCARLAGCSCDESLALAIKSLAGRRNLPGAFLLELVNEIRSGRPRQSNAPLVHVTFPLAWEEKKTAVLARFVMERLRGDEGRVFLDPAQAFFIQMDERFQDTFNTAVAAVRKSFAVAHGGRRPTPAEDVRVRIELLDRRKHPTFLSLQGTSGGAALALGLAKCWAGGDEEADGEGLERRYAPLRNLNLEGVAVTAEVTPEGRLNKVGSFLIKAREAQEAKIKEAGDEAVSFPFRPFLTREAQSHAVNVLIVAGNQDGLEQSARQAPKKFYLWPESELTPKEITPGEELRSAKSLLVIRAANLPNVVGTLLELHANTLLSVLEKPSFIGAYLLGGSRRFPPLLLALMFASWCLLPSLWFLLVDALAFVVGIFFVRTQIKKVKRRAEVCLLPKEVAYAPGTWADMAAVLVAHQRARPFTNVCGWFKASLRQNSSRCLTLGELPRLWLRSKSFWFRFVLIPLLPLMLLSTPAQYCLAEHLFPGTADILGGESRRGDGSNVRYAAFELNRGPEVCVGRTTVGSYGLMRVFVEPKARTARSLRVTSADALSYLKAEDDGPSSRQITVPVINNEAKFYYGIDDNTPWEIELDVKVICYCGRVLKEARLVGNRAPPRQ